ncbi:hypothetical protein H6F76_05645 [Leptolyngbya sp. FACHB-321]|uniref:hypothetical protein n=1 Tax=Leptolyngbya sp. FACHB-321 TaxID=2692807 RepID=UPI0016876CE8|nr:hypothetical protein [Leptolyngbya sp. FACHB-321]MBD2034516.1 hypothetical protein [Leptolyngbya sp. FACHB-321]
MAKVNSKTAASKTTPVTAATGKQAKLPVTSFPCGNLSLLSLLTRPYTRAGSALIGLEELSPDEQTMFLKFLEFAGKPLQPLDLTKILRVSVESDAETGVLALKKISSFSVAKDGDKMVLTLGANNWEIKQKNTEAGAVFQVGKLTSPLSCNSPKDNESVAAWFNWRVKDTTVGQVYEWSDSKVWLLTEEHGEATTVQDLRGVMTDGDDLLPLLALKLVLPEPVWKLAYPGGDDTQEQLMLPLEFDITGVSIKTYTGGSGSASRVVHLKGAPYETVAVRRNAASTVDALVKAGKTTFGLGTYKLQIFSVEIDSEGKHLTGHQILQGKAVTLDIEAEEVEYEEEDVEAEYETDDEDVEAEYEEEEPEEADETEESEETEEEDEY